MKKFVTFSNFMVLLGIMTILFYLIPAVHITVNGDTQYYTNINLFGASFGTAITIKFFGETVRTYALVACGGLITAFFLGIVGIVLTFLKCKNKYANLLAFPFYTAAGVLVACTTNLVSSVNFNVAANGLSYSMLGGAITVATFWCILAFFALCDFIATVARPRQPANPAY